MRHYEIMIILDPNLEERSVQPSLEGFLKVITSNGGSVAKLDIWGKRRLAYQIEKKPEGIYAVVDLTAEPATVQEPRPSAEPQRGRAADEGPAARAPLSPDHLATGPPWRQVTRRSRSSATLLMILQLRFTASGQPVATFRVASTPRIRDNSTGEWKDGDSLFLTCNVWRQMAENCAESLQRGMRVIVSGRLRQRNYETQQGEKRTVYEIEADDVGPSLLRASAKVTRATRRAATAASAAGVRRG